MPNFFDQFDSAAPRQDPVIAVDPYKQNAEVRAGIGVQNDATRLSMEAERLRIAQQEAERARQKESQDALEKGAKVDATRSAAAQELKRTIQAIDSAAVLSGEDNGWWETGKSGALVRSLPNVAQAGTDSRTLEGYLKTINANTALSKIMDMKANSPTGSGMGGATSDRDLELLQSSVANLDPDQDQQSFFSNLATTKRAYLNMLEKVDPAAAKELASSKGIRWDEKGNALLVANEGPIATEERRDPYGILGANGEPPTVPPTSPGGGDLTRSRLADTDGGLVDLAKQGITFGLADEAAGVGGGISGLLTGEGFASGYARERDLARARVADARKDYGAAGSAVEFLGGGGAARIAAPVGNALGAIVKQGAALGGIGGFGYGEGAAGSAGNALLGAGAGAALGGVLGGAGRMISRRAGGPGPTAEQLGVVQSGEREGVRVMTSDVRPPRTFTGKIARAAGERIPFAGTAGPRAAQQEQRVAAVKNLLDEYGATNADDAVSAVSNDLVATRGAEIGRLTTQKNAVISALQGPVPAPNAIAAIDTQIAKLNGINDEAFAPVVQKLQSFRDTLASGKTLEQVEGNRKLLGDLFQDPSLAAIKGDGQKALNAVYKPLRDDMGAFIKQQGGNGAFAKWKNANDKLSAMAGDLDATAFKSLLNKAETTPEAAAKIMFGKTPSDMKKLYGSLSDAGKAKAQSAILYQAAEKSADGDVISPQKFATAMEALDRATGVFFAPADKARIDGLTKLLKATQQASTASAAPPTGAQNTQLAGGYTLATIFGRATIPVTGAIGLLARAYESTPVRNALLRLGRAPANSESAGKAMNGVYAALSKFAANDNAAAALSRSPGSLAAQESGDSRREPPQQ